MRQGWPGNAVVYEVNTWVWLGEAGRRAGRALTLADVPGHEWDALVPRGIDAVWLMGVWERSPAGRDVALADARLRASWDAALPGWTEADVVGSPYCVRSYEADPRLGGAEGLAAARAALSERGARLVVDFVPNHTAPDHPWLASHPDAYVRGSAEEAAADPAAFLVLADGTAVARGRDPFFPPWPDVAQLNAFSPAYRALAAETLEAIARQADGVRVDMAMLLLSDVVRRTWGDRAGPDPGRELWDEVLSPLRQSRPGFLVVAEAYWGREPDLLALGFDACYDKGLYDALAGDAGGVRYHLGSAPEQARTVRFVENHDEPRAAAHFPPTERERAVTLVTATVPGITLWHEGQLEGRRTQLPVFLARRPDEGADHELAEVLRRILAAAPRLRPEGGTWTQAATSGWPDNTSHESLVAWTWTAPGARSLVVVNLSGAPAQARVHLPWDDLAGRSWRLDDAVEEEAFERSGDELAADGLFVDLPPWGRHAFVVA